MKNAINVIPDRVAQRALTHSDLDPHGCRISRYSVASHGYAQIGWNDLNGRRCGTTAHRAAWVAVNGQIPEGMTVDHTCKQRRCVNPAHLRLLTNYENARRTSGRDWPIGECANGHSNSNLRVVDGGRHVKCGICNDESKRRYQEKRAS
ncbi:HNH endonuclease signature motif containing protein [Prescottella equi]|uniref:HNH endonuclease signature motif containing protein n=1 Tax=Rhodococcus hoagii TaxID=43767 RepID=UPI000A10BCB1|nr:HNH endonuclease signature motif containing protein [Prescottella equi]